MKYFHIESAPAVLALTFRSHMELVTVLSSNHFSLGGYIIPDLFSQLQSLKEHMGIDSFATYQ